LTSELPDSPKTQRSRGKLLQVLGMWFGIAAAVGNTIAAGIVAAQGEIARELPTVWLFLGVWVVGGIYAFFGASSMAEVGASIPRSGGQYNFARRGLGEYPGFIVGWSDWLSTAGTNAAVAIIIGEYSRVLFPIVSGYERHLSASILVLFAILQWHGVKWGSGAQLLTSAVKTGAFIVLVIACFVLGGHFRAELAATSPVPVVATGWLLALGFMRALQKVIYTVDGWDGIIYFGEEVKDPGKEVPRAIFGSVFSIIGIYMLLNAAVAYVLPMGAIAGNEFALGTAAQHTFGRYGDTIVRSIIIVSLLSCINACQMFCTRILYSMSRDGLFFRQAATVNKGGTPVLALLLSTIVGCMFIVTKKFNQVIDMLAFFFVANYTLTYLSVFVLRKREPDMPRPYRAWGYPWTTGFALVGSVLFLIGALYADQKNTPWAAGILVLSYPIFWVMKRFSKSAATSPT
jgi:APA family basic amino acid/polyamine antiporter